MNPDNDWRRWPKIAVAGVLSAAALMPFGPAAIADQTTAARPVLAAPADCSAPEDLELQDQDYDDDQLPWERRNGEEVVIAFETKDVTPEYRADLEKGVAAWDRSPCIKPILVDECPEDGNCVTVGLEESDGGDDDGNFDSIEEGDFTTGGHIIYYVDMLEEQGPVATLNVVIHEMGHAVGLRHRATEGVLMHGDTNEVTEPDEIDYENLLVLYGNQ